MNEEKMQLQSSGEENPPGRFISLRWRFLTPFYFVVLAVTMLAAYLLSQNLTDGLQVSQTNLLLQTSRSVRTEAAELYRFHRAEAQRGAFTSGVADAMANQDTAVLSSIVEALLSLNGMDSLILVQPDGTITISAFRAQADDSEIVIFEAIQGEPGDQLFFGALTDAEGLSEFVSTPYGLILFTGYPIRSNGQVVGTALVGQRLSAVLEQLRQSAIAELALYSLDGSLLATTFDLESVRPPLSLSTGLVEQVFESDQQVPVQPLEVNSIAYNAAYRALVFGEMTLGVVAVFMPDDVPFIAETGQQLTALGSALLVGAAVTAAFALISRISSRAGQVADVAVRLAEGHKSARTGMTPTDEIMAVGYSLDQYADRVQETQDKLRSALRRQRREINHFLMIFESIPDGVVVQDLDGRVVVMNEQARELLGSQRVFRSAGLHELDDLVSANLGTALAPGLYTLGDPHRVNLDGKVLSAQAAAIMSETKHRVGTVVLLRDMTPEIRKERERDVMLERLAEEIQQPLALIGQAGDMRNPNLMRVLVKEITRHSVALQKLIMDMRELSNVDMISVQRRQRPLSLETLVWALTNDWRQIAQANGLTLHVMIMQHGLYVLGDEKRLRWAIGNVIDNAIKYTLPGGALTLEVQPEVDGGWALLRVRDNGVGIARDDRSLIFTRFFRGTPMTADGQVIRVPGMGQGLYTARQIIESHGGTIYVKSSQNVGTAVYINLPQTASVGLELPQFAEMDGETQQLPESLLIEIDDQTQAD